MSTKTIQARERQVTKILLYVEQAAHELVSLDILQIVYQTIANNFITKRKSGKVMTVVFVY